MVSSQNSRTLTSGSFLDTPRESCGLSIIDLFFEPADRWPRESSHRNRYVRELADIVKSCMEADYGDLRADSLWADDEFCTSISTCDIVVYDDGLFSALSLALLLVLALDAADLATLANPTPDRAGDFCDAAAGAISIINSADILPVFHSTLVAMLDRVATSTDTQAPRQPSPTAWRRDRAGILAFIANKHGRCTDAARRVCDSTLWPEFSLHLALLARHTTYVVMQGCRRTPTVAACVARTSSWLQSTTCSALSHAAPASSAEVSSVADANWLCKEVMAGMSGTFTFLNLLTLTSLSDCRQVPASVLDSSSGDEAVDVVRVSASHLMPAQEIETAG